MKFLFSILALLLTVKECDQKNVQTDASKTELTDNMEKATQQENYTISYSAFSRGTFMEVSVSDSEIKVKKDRSGKATTMALSDDDKATLNNILKNIDITSLPKLKAPTEKRFFDGAAHANLTITKGDETYQTEGFDHGYPPEEIKPLCEEILKLSEKDSSEKKSSEETTIQGKYSVVFISDLNYDDFKDKGLTINFTDNAKVSGFNGCNNYSADCTIENNTISVGIMMTTKRYCQDEMEIGGKLMAKLRAANRFIIKENTVTLLDENEVLIKAEKTTEKE